MMNTNSSQMNRLPDIKSIRERLWQAEVTCVQLLEQAQAAAQLHANLNVLAYQQFDQALIKAEQDDLVWAHARSQNKLDSVPALQGLPMTVKDLFAVRNMPMRAGSNAALPKLNLDEAVLVQRLKAAGVNVFAKTNMHEIAMGATGENFWTGDVKNPIDPDRQAGGSSSGSAVAVATGIGVASVGSDTGGSIRVPAAFCGVTGFKPSFNSIPLGGALFLSPSFDHAGPIARNVADARLLYGIMAARQPRSFSMQRPPKFGVLKDWLDGRLAPRIAQQFEQTITVLRAAGATIEVVDVPLMHRQWDLYMPIARAEAAMVHKEALRSHADGFSPATLKALRAGAAISAVDYLEAQALRSVLRHQVEAVLQQCDGLILPTSAISTPLRSAAGGQLQTTIANGFTNDVRDSVLGQTAVFSALGLPAISIPCGAVMPSDGAIAMPVGLQLVGNPQRDDFLLSLAQWCEQEFVNAAV
jgi:aspartyl-tRNA(Asn)/glutamyl-tRNA(Gln) amidotransferase subunit A